jgi:hypothetical protein
MADNKIPQSVLIADTRQKLAELSDRELPPSVLELLFKEAWLSVNFRAEREVKTDYEKYLKANAEKDKQEEAE